VSSFYPSCIVETEHAVLPASSSGTTQPHHDGNTETGSDGDDDDEQEMAEPAQG
jgi:hypothetical protein